MTEISITQLESIATAKGITTGEALDEIVEMELGKRFAAWR